MENKRIFEILVQALSNFRQKPREYSGRGMFGAKCIGVECSNPAAMQCTIFQSCLKMIMRGELTLDDANDFVQALKDVSYDQLGREMILYWPSIEWIEGIIADEEYEDV